MRGVLGVITGLFAVSLATAGAGIADPLRLGSTGAVAVMLQRLAEAHAVKFPNYHHEIVPGLGSGGAIAAITQGALDLAISSRDINDKERAAGAVSIPLLQTPYVFVSATSQPLSLTPEDILGFYAGTSRAYPNGETVRLILRPRSDANTVYVTGAIPGMIAAQEKARQRHDIPVAGTDQDNMQAMNSIPGAFSGMSLTQLSMEPNALQRVRINNTQATVETMKTGAYPYKITMFIVVGRAPGPAAKSFQAFLTSEEGRTIIEAAGGQVVMP